MSGVRRGGPADRAGQTIHEGLVGARALVGTAYLAEPALRAAYARDLAPRTEAALTRILGQRGVGAHLKQTRRAEGRPLRALDLGSGTGAAGSALDRYFGADGIERTSVDRHVVGPGIRNLDLANPASVAVLGGGFDLVVASHLLNELFVSWQAPEKAEERLTRLAELVERWGRGLLAPGGLMVLIEPALRETSRDLLHVRDRLLAGGKLRVRAPCLYQGPCPALARERDWCHDAAPGIETRRRIDFSYLVLDRLAREDEGRCDAGDAGLPGAGLRTSRSAGADGSVAGGAGAMVRVVSDPLVEKGKLRLFVCGERGRFPIVRLDRHASEPNRALGSLARGDLARISALAVGSRPAGNAGPETERADGHRVGADWSIQRIDEESSQESMPESPR
jgi:hypothetical protein